MGHKTVKIAISLPAELLQALERERQISGESRSEFFRHAVEQMLCQAQEREAVARYVRGYQKQPETDDEVAAAHRAAIAAVAQEPWE